MAIDTMKANLTDPQREIDMYGWMEVTSHRSFVSSTNMLNPEGLYSEEIFGKQATPERKTRWGYISLNDVFMNPHAFYVLSRIKRSLANDMKMGLGRYYVDVNGEVQSININTEKVPETAKFKEVGTGFDWLKRAWPYISWKTTKQMSNMAKIMRNFLASCTLGEIFWDKLLVMPAFYRDIDPKSNKRNKINNFYSRALSLANIIKVSGNLMFIDDPETPIKTSAHIKMQTCISEIYSYFIDKVGGTHGFANENVLGKSTDYGARLVISTPDFNVNHYKDAEADFFHSSVPLATTINIFAPFIVYGITQWIQQYVNGNRSAIYWDLEKGQFVREELDPTFMEEFTPDAIRKSMDNYKNSKAYRINAVTLRGKEGKRIPICIYFNDLEKDSAITTSYTEYVDKFDPKEMVYHYRYLTWCELFYIVAESTVKNKTIYNTRYPLTTYNNTYCSLQNIIPTTKYKKTYFNGELYDRYPIIEVKEKGDIERMFTDTMRMCSVYLDAMGADYDGDQISTQGLFSNEGNEDAIKHMKSVSNVVGINTMSIREFPHVVKHGIYGLTYRTKKPAGK